MDINDFRFHVIDSEDAVRLYSGEGYADLFKFLHELRNENHNNSGFGYTVRLADKKRFLAKGVPASEILERYENDLEFLAEQIF